MYLEVGGVRIHLEHAGQVPVALSGLMQVANQKSAAHLLGITPRTYRRWRKAGKVPPLAGQTLARLLQELATLPASTG